MVIEDAAHVIQQRVENMAKGRALPLNAVFLDVYDSTCAVPPHLASLSFIGDCRRCLTEGVRNIDHVTDVNVRRSLSFSYFVKVVGLPGTHSGPCSNHSEGVPAVQFIQQRGVLIEPMPILHSSLTRAFVVDQSTHHSRTGHVQTLIDALLMDTPLSYRARAETHGCPVIER